MSLFAAIRNSANALSVADLGLQVTGNNVANANTPGYIRQELVQTSGPSVLVGAVLLGYGVRAVGVVQKIDTFVAERLRDMGSELAANEAIGDVYNRLESVFNELSDADISSSISDFSNSIHDLLNQPGNPSLRRLVIERAKKLSADLGGVKRQLGSISSELDSEIRGTASEINRLTKSVATLNQRIVELEGGRTLGSDAVGLRDERYQALQELASLIDIRAVEQTSGSVSIFVGGEFLVADGIQRDVTYALASSNSTVAPEIRIVDTDSPLVLSSGKLKGFYDARVSTLPEKTAEIDDFAKLLIQEFNAIHTQGQGLEGFSSVTGTNAADDASAAVDLSGLFGEIQNGSFEIQVLDRQTGLKQTHEIRVRLLGESDDTSLEDIRDQITAISGISASISNDGQLTITSDSERTRFAFQNDTSGFLAAVGINTFFQGTSADTISVNEQILENDRLFAASVNGIDGGTDNALRLAEAFDAPLESLNGLSIKQQFENIVVSTTQDINIQNGITDGLRNFYKVLEGQHLAVTGVNLDEEAVKMIFYQRAFQASSRVIKASSEMLETLVNL